MATRSIIAQGTPESRVGVYHHWDGYIRGLGRSLVNQAKNFPDLKDMFKILHDENPADWSTIVGRDLRLPAIWDETIEDKAKHETHPISYTARGEEANSYKLGDDLSGAEYLYVIDTDKRLMYIYTVKYNGKSLKKRDCVKV